MELLHLTNPLTRGDDVKSVQEALIADKFLSGTVDGVFGPLTGAACKRAKYWYGYPSWACQETASQTLLNYLRGTEALPLSFRLRRKARQFATKQGKEDAIRSSIASYAKWGAGVEPQIHYAQIRPIPVRAAVKALPITTDCSGWVTLLYKWAGASDPNGLGYNGEGYTGTLLMHGRPITQAEARPGDLIIWGSYPGHHVAVCVESGPDPLICSHGAERGPLLEKTSVETAAQGGRSYQWRNYLS